ncbi:MAG: ABC transporter ATP-binding protein [Acidimicrobiia bacterium]|nr:ABC transporter ATP-binding protein [Acidimicrobiia bacterium]
MTSSDPAIRVRGLTKSYKKVQALAGVDFDVPAGKVTGFVGPNGAGKTTTFRALLGLTRPDSGTIEMLGLPVPRELAVITRRCGAIIEEPGLLQALSGHTNMQIAADTLGLGHGRIQDLLEFVGLADDARRKVSEYSKGMRQRLALAAALIAGPELLLLDEPLDGLDPVGQKVFRSRLRELADEGATVVVSSHDMADIEAIADHLIVIRRGSIAAAGPLDSLLDGGGTRVVIENPSSAMEVLRAAGIEARFTGSELFVSSQDRERIVRTLGAAQMFPSEVSAHRSSLESVFFELTGEEEE